MNRRTPPKYRAKFRKPNGPAFAPGEVWYGHAGKIEARIVGRRRFGPGKFDYWVHYTFPGDPPEKPPCRRSAWDFQVRYEHSQDRRMRLEGEARGG